MLRDKIPLEILEDFAGFWGSFVGFWEEFCSIFLGKAEGGLKEGAKGRRKGADSRL